MRCQIITTILLITVCLNAAGQFKPNSIGVCYLEKETSDTYFVTIAFPFKTLAKYDLPETAEIKDIIDSLNFDGQIILFDSLGKIGAIKSNEKIKLSFWCDNDGGTQYRPTIKTDLAKSSLKRKLKVIKAIQNICCFALTNKNENMLKPAGVETATDIRLKGDYNNDHKTDCFLWTRFDEAENCSGEPENNLDIMLRVESEDYFLRCCGP